MPTHRSASLLSALAVSAAALLTAAPALAEGPTDQETFAVASNGQPTPVRHGFFAQTALGGFATFGGKSGYSNMEAFLALGVGFDFLSDFSFGVQFQLAPSAENCYATDGICGSALLPNSGSKTFTMAGLNAVLSYRIQLVERLYIPIRVMGGMANFAPLPDNSAVPGVCPPGTPNCTAGQKIPSSGDVWEPTFGLATGIEYATGFEHFTISLEASVQDIPFISAFALSIYPQIKYTF